jgi:hypothetical protein
MNNFVTPRQLPLLNEKSIKLLKYAIVITLIIFVMVLCSG